MKVSNRIQLIVFALLLIVVSIAFSAQSQKRTSVNPSTDTAQMATDQRALIESQEKLRDRKRAFEDAVGDNTDDGDSGGERRRGADQ